MSPLRLLDISCEHSEETTTANSLPSQKVRRHQILWLNVIGAIIMHIIGIYGIFLCFTSAHILSTLSVFIFHFIGSFGVTGGSHRLWTHKAFKAKWPLRVLLMLCATLSYQGTIYQWVRDHRVHHKYSDTDADPYNITNGFLFAHVGWLLCKKFPDVVEMGKKNDLQDLFNDPIVTFQKKHMVLLVILISIGIPIVIPMYFWEESLTNAFCLNMLRYLITAHSALSINSFAHSFGGKPYDKSIKPTENKMVSIVTAGEGFHNYHHAFPWDYKASELGNYSLNTTAALIELFAKIGWAYDLRTASEEMVKKRCLKTGDGSHEKWNVKRQKPEHR